MPYGPTDMMKDLLIVSRDIEKETFNSLFSLCTRGDIFVMRVGEILNAGYKFENLIIGCRILSDADMRWYHSHLLSLLTDPTKQPLWTT